MKLLTLAMILVIVQLSVGLWDRTIDIEGSEAIPTPYGTNVSINSTTNYLYNFVLNPTSWADSALIAFLIGVTVFIASASIVAGIFKYTPSDTVWFAGVFSALIGLGSIPIGRLFSVIDREIKLFACVPGAYCTPAIIVAGLTAGLLGLAWVLVCLNWWRTGSTGS